MARRSSVVALLVLSLAACATAFDLSEPGGVELSRVIRLSDKDPRAFLYKSFLSDESATTSWRSRPLDSPGRP
ncbi:hypothetical protein CLOM_g321 [Closterium sp. NIES-68]|nr:hypothetical protein CLOM_g321 [Closterium sp. NIES-68]